MAGSGEDFQVEKVKKWVAGGFVPLAEVQSILPKGARQASFSTVDETVKIETWARALLLTSVVTSAMPTSESAALQDPPVDYEHRDAEHEHEH